MKSPIAPINLRKEILRPGLNFIMLFITISRTRSILTSCGKTPVWQRPAFMASKTCRLSKTPFLPPQTTILCNLIQETNIITPVFKVPDPNPSPVYDFTRPKTFPLMPTLRRRKFELTNELITFAFTAVTQTTKSKIALLSNRMTIVEVNQILIRKSAASKPPPRASGALNPSNPNTNTVPSIFARSRIEKVLLA
jgi:hypothetical protein